MSVAIAGSRSSPTRDSLSGSARLGVLGAYAISYAVMYYPQITMIAKGFAGDVTGDPALAIWLIEQNVDRFFTWPSPGFDAGFFFPFGRSLAFSDSYLLPSLVAKLVFGLTGSRELAYNLPLVISWVLCGYFTFLLSLRICGRPPFAFVAGFSFMFLPFFPAHLGHPQLQYAFFLPAVVLAALRFAEGRKAAQAVPIGLMVCLAFMCSAYYAMYVYLLGGLTLLGYGMLRWRTIRLRDVGWLVLANVPWLLVIMLLAEPYLQVREAFQADLTAIAQRYSATFSSYLSASGLHLLWGSSTRSWGEAAQGAHFFTGAINLAFGAGAIVWLIGASDPGGSLRMHRLYRGSIGTAVAAVGALVLAPLWPGVAGNPSAASVSSVALWTLLVATAMLLVVRGLRPHRNATLDLTDRGLLCAYLLVVMLFASLGFMGDAREEILLPPLYQLMFDHLPGYGGLRAVFRIGVVACLFVILLSSVGMSLAASALFSRAPKRVWVVAAALLIGLVVELKTVPIGVMAKPARPPVYGFLESVPGDEAVVTLPFGTMRSDHGTFLGNQTAYMQWAQSLERPLMNGYSGVIPQLYQTAGATLDTFPSPRSLGMLGRFVGLRYLIYHGTRVSDFEREPFERRVEAAGDQLVLLYRDETDANLFELRPTVSIFGSGRPMIYLPPSSGERELTFELMHERADWRGPQRVAVAAIVSEDAPSSTLELVSRTPNQWQAVSLRVPASADPVRPHRVRFERIDSFGRGDQILLRNLAARPIE